MTSRTALCGCAAHCVKKGSYRSDLDWIHGAVIGGQGGPS